jgi:hypothetical protein
MTISLSAEFTAILAIRIRNDSCHRAVGWLHAGGRFATLKGSLASLGDR